MADEGEPSSVEEARAVLEEIAESRGFLDDETLEDVGTLQPRSQQKVKNVAQTLRDKLGAHAKEFIAEQLYSTKFRFIYELIQNADDADYKRAVRNQQRPYLSFDLAPHLLVVETNEDGFQRDNIEAICETGKSSKKASDGDQHIGEKGFGFKSVFAIANKVKIQSLLWSFYFEHNDGESGIGMVTPKCAPHEILAPNVTTRITLHLTQEQQNSFQALVEEIDHMPDSTILYLQHLEKLDIHVTDAQGFVTTTSLECRKESPGQVRLTRKREYLDSAGRTTTSEMQRLYRTFSHKVRNMPEDRRRPSRREAEVSLAFPINALSGAPAIDHTGEYIFAYLPLKRLLQLKFLIQSDFITSASREETVDCGWNRQLRKGVVDTFCKSVVEFCKDDKLIYSWLSYLPVLPMEGLWKTLYSEIIASLKEKPILQSWETRSLKTPSQLRVVPSGYLHDGIPLLADLVEEIYLAPQYNSADHLQLNEMGAATMSLDDFFRKVDLDLASVKSRIRSTATSDAWHNSFSLVMTVRLDKLLPMSTSLQQKFERLKIIPLRDRWISATDLKSLAAYLPETEGVAVPIDLSLQLIQSKAAAHPKRRDLFRSLGVRDCDPAKVISHVLRVHKLGKSNSGLNLISHFAYLYWFSPDVGIVKNNRLFAMTTQSNMTREVQDLYFTSIAEYDTENLLKPLSHAEMKSAGLAEFIHRGYYEAQLPEGRRHGRSWIQWLRIVAGIRYYPKLASKQGSDLSVELRHVLSACPSKFIGVLKAHWEASYRAEFTSIPGLQPILNASQVPCENGELVKLADTYLPTPRVNAKVQELGLAGQLHILILPEVLGSANYRSWQFLEDLGTSGTTNLEFFLQALLAVSRLVESNSGTYQSTVFAIYKHIGNLCSQNTLERVKEIFEDEPVVYVPSHPSTKRWQFIDKCVWNAPTFLTVKVPLALHYAADADLKALFSTFLEVPDADYNDYLEELQQLMKTPVQQVKTLSTSKIYEQLLKTLASPGEWDTVRKSFEGKALVFANDAWYKPSSCLWTSTISISGKAILGNIYPDLKPFFVNQLKVKTADVGMAISELLRRAKASARPTIAEVKDLILKIAPMLQEEIVDERVIEKLEALKKVDCLPVCISGGESTLMSPNADFALLDHHLYGGAFRMSANILDFTFDETQRLHQFIKLLGLDDRCLSLKVEEKSEVEGGVVVSELLSQNLADRAYALFCCGARFGSRKTHAPDDSLFKHLRNIKVFTTDQISSNLTLRQNGMLLKVRNERKQLLFKEEDSFKLFLPQNRRDRSLCSSSQLPELFLEILGISNPAATHTIGLLLNADLEILDDMLKERDVAPVSWIAKPSLHLSVLSRVYEDPEHVITRSTSSVPAPITPNTTRISLSLPPPTSSPLNFGQPRTPLHSLGIQVDQRAASITFEGIPIRAANAQMENYRWLLDQIIKVVARMGRSTTSPDSRDASVWEGLPTTSDPDSIFGVRSLDQFAHDSKIGAAGELYVFERLLKEIFPSFNRDNWPSSIRHEVTVHRKYANMESRRAREPADIVYTDTDGSFTRFLRRNCFDSFPWPEDQNDTFSPIVYFLEVKATTQQCDARFFMSNSQYKRMRKMHDRLKSSRKEVYVIVRVFNLTSENIDMRDFVEPWRFKERGFLRFDASDWIVTSNRIAANRNGT